MKELEVTLKVRNNLLKERRLKLGFSQAEMALAIGIPLYVYSGFENMSRSPVKTSGEWTQYALVTSEYFDCQAEEIFPPNLLKIEKPKSVKKIDFTDLRLLLSDHSQRASVGSEQHLIESSKERTMDFLTNRSVSLLRPDEAELVRDRFGFGDEEPKSAESMAKERGLSVKRVHHVLRIATMKVEGEIVNSLRGDKRFIVYYQEVFGEGIRELLVGNIIHRLRIKFPSTIITFKQRNWMPCLVMTRVYGFADETKGVQEEADSITTSVFNSRKWPLKNKKRKKKPKSSLSEPIFNRFVMSYPVRTLELVSYTTTSEKISIADEIISIVSGPKPMAVIVTYASKESAFRLAEVMDQFFYKMIKKGMCESIYDNTVNRTIVVFKNGSSIDLVPKN